MDSKLVSIVRELENEAERILQEGKGQAAGIQRENADSRARLVEQKQAGAKREAEQLIQDTRGKTQEQMERSRVEAKAALAALLRRAEARLEKASRLILDRLGKP